MSEFGVKEDMFSRDDVKGLGKTVGILYESGKL
jgi:hypothetical protein